MASFHRQKTKKVLVAKCLDYLNLVSSLVFIHPYFEVLSSSVLRRDQRSDRSTGKSIEEAALQPGTAVSHYPGPKRKTKKDIDPRWPFLCARLN